MLKTSVPVLRLLDSKRSGSQQARGLGQVNEGERRQCVGYLLGKQLVPSAILPCPILVPAVKLTMHSVPVRRVKRALLSEWVGGRNTWSGAPGGADGESPTAFSLQSLKLGLVVSAKQCVTLCALSIVLH